VDRRSWLPEDVRAHNRGLLLRLLTEHGSMSRRQLAHQTGLSIPTVTSIITDLTGEGYVTESVPTTRASRRGPRAAVVALARNAYTVLGVDIGADAVRVGLTDLSGLLTEVTEVPFEPAAPAGRVLADAIGAAAPLVASAGDNLAGIGVGVPGPVDPARRRNVLSLLLGWHDVDVADAFERAFGVATVVDYNVRAMAAAEARHGLGRRAENLLYVHVGDGVGFAFVVDGRPFRQGAHGVSELGHQQVVAGGPTCVCGATGCLEAVVREANLRAQVAAAGLQGAERAPLDVLDAAAQAGDAVAGRLLAEFVDHVSTAVAVNVNVFSPSRVALGGILAHAPKEAFEQVVGSTRAKVCAVLRDRVTIEASAIGPYPGLLGAATVALDDFFYDRGAVPAGLRLAADPI
jgi:predicted NBD/HSP70 family sugar kinase